MAPEDRGELFVPLHPSERATYELIKDESESQNLINYWTNENRQSRRYDYLVEVIILMLGQDT